MSRDWYAHNPRDFIDGIIGLGPECIGAYITILDLIYLREGPIRNDGRWLSGIMGCSKRLADSLVLKLIEAGKLTLIDGHLSNVRAEFELENSAKLMRNQREWGANGGRMSAERRTKSNEINENGQGSLKQETRQDKTGQYNTVASATDGEPSPAEPVDLKAMLFSSGVPYLVRNGTKDANARAMLGKWRKQYGDGAVIDAIAAAQSECASAPIPMIIKILEARNGRTGKPKRDTEPSNPMVIEFARMAGHIPPDGRTANGNGRCDATGAPASAGEHPWPTQLALSGVKHN